jgi:hypothetical protein
MAKKKAKKKKVVSRKKLVRQLAARPGVKDAKTLAAWIINRLDKRTHKITK